MSLLQFIVVFMFNCALVKSYSENYYGGSPRISQFADDGLLEVPYDDSERIYPYADEVRIFNKRSFPRWFHAFIYRNPNFRTSGIAETKRFLPPFHPLARFRGLTMGGGGSSVGGGADGMIAAPFRPRQNFDAFIPSPAHPVPSDPKMKSLPRIPYLAEIEDENHLGSENGTMQTDDDKMNAGDILRYLSSVSADKGSGGRSRIFRFGIK